MGFRDDVTALRARVEVLESELAEGRGQSGLGEPAVRRTKRHIEVSRTLPHRISEDAYGEAVEVLRQAFGTVGHDAHTATGFVWRSSHGEPGNQTSPFRRFVEVSLTPTREGMAIRVTEDLTPLRGMQALTSSLAGAAGIFAGIPLAVAIDNGPGLLAMFGVAAVAAAGGFLATGRSRRKKAAERETEISRVIVKLAALTEPTTAGATDDAEAEAVVSAGKTAAGF